MSKYPPWRCTECGARLEAREIRAHYDREHRHNDETRPTGAGDTIKENR